MKYLLTTLVCLVISSSLHAEKPRTSELFVVPGTRVAALTRAYPHSVASLTTGPIWDIRDYIAKQGVPVAPDDTILWAPRVHLVFSRTSRETTELLDTLFTATDSDVYWIDFEFVISRKLKDADPEKLFQFTCRSKSGQTSNVQLGDSSKPAHSIKVFVSPLVGPDGTTIDSTIAFDGVSSGVSVSLKGEFTLKDQTQSVLWTSTERTSETSYSCTVLPHISVFSSSARMKDSEEKIKKLSAIEAETK